MGLFRSGNSQSPELIWEALKNTNGSSSHTYRTKIPGGWLVTVSNTQGAGVTFVPDAKHEWDGNSV
ncbi:hypothetical protein DS731_12820 [Alteromonas sp. RKMC-009]|nr:hypothetical protein DS731_12820 [Alteromonas sp. RKMC-009]